MSFNSNFLIKKNDFSYDILSIQAFSNKGEDGSENNSTIFGDVPNVQNVIQLHQQNQNVEEVREMILEGLMKGGIHSAVQMMLDFFSETQKNKRPFKNFLNQECRKYQEIGRNCFFDFLTLRKILSTYADLKERDFHLIFRELDGNCTGYISIEDFNNWLFGSLEEERLQLILSVFQGFRCNENNRVELCEICSQYNQKNHPDVINYKSSSNKVFKEFIELVNQYADDEGVNIDAFIHYHRALSVCIVHDDQFVEVNNALWSNNKNTKTIKPKQEILVQKEEDSEKISNFEDKFSRINSSCSSNKESNFSRNASPFSSNKESNIFTNVSPFQSFSTNKTIEKQLFSSNNNNNNSNICKKQGGKKQFDSNKSNSIHNFDNIKCQVNERNYFQKENLDNKKNKLSNNSQPSVMSIAEINRKKMMTSSIQF